MDALSLGVLVAWAKHHGKLSPRSRLISATVVAFAAAAILTIGKFDALGWVVGTIGYTVFDIFYAGVLALVVILRPTMPTLLIPLQWLGLGAYSIYLFHSMLLDLCREYFGATPAMLVLFTALISVTACLCWRGVERPLMEFAHRRFRYSPRRSDVVQTSGSEQLHPAA